MPTVKQVAEAFVAGKNAKCGNAVTDGVAYVLHRSVIAIKKNTGEIEFSYCNWFTPTTANHINEILRAMGSDMRRSYAKDRDAGIKQFSVKL